jgi:hypothetical protein
MLDRHELTALALLLLRAQRRARGLSDVTRADLERARARVLAALARSAGAYQRK